MAPPHEEDEEKEGSESEAEDDERIMKLIMKQDQAPEDLAAYLRELGGDDAIIYGDLYVGRPREAMAFFFLNAAACFNEEEPIAPQIEKKLPLFKAFFTADEKEEQAALLVILELFCRKERPQGLKEASAWLKVLWENDIVAEEILEAWHGNEHALQEASFTKHWDQDDAILVRESGREFIEWMQAGEDGY